MWGREGPETWMSEETWRNLYVNTKNKTLKVKTDCWNSRDSIICNNMTETLKQSEAKSVVVVVERRGLILIWFYHCFKWPYQLQTQQERVYHQGREVGGMLALGLKESVEELKPWYQPQLGRQGKLQC